MKICLLSLGRSGSTSLYTAITKHLNEHYCIGEPFNIALHDIDEQFNLISKKENVFIKTILTHKPNGIDNDTFNHWLFTFFDKVILLDRHDKKAQAESFSFLVHTKNKEWHRKKFYDMSLVPLDFFEEWDNRLIVLKNKLNELSLKYNKKIYYYEDIFVNKNKDIIDEIFNYLEIKINQNIINEYILSEDYKVRLKEKTNKLI